MSDLVVHTEIEPVALPSEAMPTEALPAEALPADATPAASSAVSASTSAEPPPAGLPHSALAAEQRASLLALVASARDLPPGVRERLTRLVEQSSALDDGGEPLLAARGVLDLLAQGLPAVLRREAPAAITRPEHPVGDAFFALSGADLSEQQAEQIARTQLERAGLLRPDK